MAAAALRPEVAVASRLGVAAASRLGVAAHLLEVDYWGAAAE